MSTSKPRLAARTAGLDEAVTRAFHSVLFSPDVMSFGAGFMNPPGFDVAGVRCAGASPQGHLRVGWVVAPAEIARVLAPSKQALDMSTSTIDQAAAAIYLEGVDWERLTSELRAAYATLMTAMVDRLAEEYSPTGPSSLAPRTGSSCGRRWRTAGPPAHCWSARCGTACYSCPGRSSSRTSRMTSR